MKLPLGEENPLIIANNEYRTFQENSSELWTNVRCSLVENLCLCVYRIRRRGRWGKGGVVITGGAADPCHTHQKALDGATVLVQNLPFSNHSETLTLSVLHEYCVCVSHVPAALYLPWIWWWWWLSNRHSHITQSRPHPPNIVKVLPCSGHIQVSLSLPLSPLDLCQPRVLSWRVQSCLHLMIIYCQTSSNSQQN